LAGKLEIKNADERRVIKSRQAVLQSADFKELWDRIKYKTTYQVHFDNEKLLATCIQKVKEMPQIAKTRLQWHKADLSIGRSGVRATETSNSAPVIIEDNSMELPDILTDLQDRTQLTRRSIYRILVESNRLEDFAHNPQEYTELVAQIIKRSKRLIIVDGIKYQRVGNEEYFAQQLTDAEELSGYLKSMIETKKTIYEQVIYQSATERTFAEELEKNEAIKVYAKLPAWFKIQTPLGPYNPDWAILVDKDGAERLFFVVETKSSLFTDDLREKELAKIKCGKSHFKELAEHTEKGATFITATSLNEVLNEC
jgi:type III restriction enzyme